jgi:hypothetical protein
MTPDSYHEFFLASAGVAGALTGLLFVAISVAPERVVADDAAQLHRVRASAALTAFTNTLTVSLFALIPGIHVGWPTTVAGILGLLFVAGSLVSLVRARSSMSGAVGDATFLAGLVVVFGLELLYGVRLIADKGDLGALDGVAVLVIFCFLIGIARSWELIGGPSIGFFTELRKALRGRGDPEP